MERKNLKYNYLLINSFFSILYLIILILIENNLIISDGVSLQSVVYKLNNNFSFNILAKMGLIFFFFNSIFAHENNALLISNLLLILIAHIYIKNFMLYEQGYKEEIIISYINKFSKLIKILFSIITLQLFINILGNYKNIKSNIKKSVYETLNISNKKLIILYSIVFIGIIIVYRIYSIFNKTY